MAVPALISSFFLWELYGPLKLRSAVQSGLFVIMVLLLPANTKQGLVWTIPTHEEEALQRDIASGKSATTIAERYNKLLLHWKNPSELKDYLLMLRNAGIAPFSQMAEGPLEGNNSMLNVPLSPTQSPSQSSSRMSHTAAVTKTIRYHMAEAESVSFVWGFNGWHVAPVDLRPPGTELYNILHTPMVRNGDVFSVALSLPVGSIVDNCFLITKTRDAYDLTWPLCDGNYKVTLLKNSVTEIRSNVTLKAAAQEIRYIAPEARQVELVWGLNGWHIAPEELRPSGTGLIDQGTDAKQKTMHTPMIQIGDIFTSTLSLPLNATMNYSFLIKKRRGLLDIIFPIWDGGIQSTSYKR